MEEIVQNILCKYVVLFMIPFSPFNLSSIFHLLAVDLFDFDLLALLPLKFSVLGNANKQMELFGASCSCTSSIFCVRKRWTYKDLARNKFST